MEKRPKSGYVVLEANLEYNDEIHYAEGHRLDDKKVYMTKQEAEESIKLSLQKPWGIGEMNICDFWYGGDEPPIVKDFLKEALGEVYQLWDAEGITVNEFVNWCEANGRDWNNHLDFYNIYEVEFV